MKLNGINALFIFCILLKSAKKLIRNTNKTKKNDLIKTTVPWYLIYTNAETRAAKSSKLS